MYTFLTLILTTIFVAGNLFAQPFEADEFTVGLWHFDEGEGEAVEDASEFGNDGIIVGASWQDTCVVDGGALYFDGNGDFIRIDDSESLSALGGDWTIELSFLVSSYPERGAYTLIRKWGRGGIGDDEFIVSIRNDGILRISIVGPSGHRTTGSLKGNIPLNRNEMINLKIVSDSSNNFLGAFVNNTLHAFCYMQQTVRQDTNEPVILGIGPWQNEDEPDFHGCIDELRISNIYRGPVYPVRPANYQQPKIIITLFPSDEEDISFDLGSLNNFEVDSVQISGGSLHFGYCGLGNIFGNYPFRNNRQNPIIMFNLSSDGTAIGGVGEFESDTSIYYYTDVSDFLEENQTVTFHFDQGDRSGPLGIIEPVLMVELGEVEGIIQPNPNLKPEKFGLNQNYPNPFNPSTTITYNIEKPGRVSIIIYNQLGQKVREVVNEVKTTGTYKVLWDGKDMNGTSVSNGTYFYQLRTKDFLSTKKSVLLK